MHVQSTLSCIRTGDVLGGRFPSLNGACGRRVPHYASRRLRWTLSRSGMADTRLDTQAAPPVS